MFFSKNILSKAKYYKNQIKFTILFSFFGLMAFTCFVVIWSTQRQFISEFSITLDEQIDTIINSLARKVFNFLEPVQDITKASSWSIAYPEQLIQDQKKIASQLMGVLHAFPQIERLAFGTERGSSLVVSRLYGQKVYRFKSAHLLPPNATYRVTFIDQGISQITEKDTYYDQDGIFVDEDKNKGLSHAKHTKHAYDPRTRCWYKGAKSTKKTFWTDVYLYSNKAEVGISVSTPVYSRKGIFIGAIAADINVNELCNFFKIQSSGPIATVFLFNRSGHLIAYPDITQIFSISSLGLEVSNLSTIRDFKIQGFYEHYKKSHKQKRIAFNANPGEYKDIIHLVDFPDSFKNGWKIGIIILGDKFLSQIDRIKTQTFVFAIIVLLLALWVMFLLSKKISQPIEAVAQDLKRIQSLDFDQILYPSSTFSEIAAMLDALKRVVTVVRSFSKFVPKTLVKQLILAGRGAQLGGEQKTLTVMFCDIKNFTGISEKIYAEQLLLHLSDYFEEMSQIIKKHHGTLDKYIGDSIMAFWGAPLPDTQHAYRACHGILACVTCLETLNEAWKAEGKPPMETRFGISTGQMLVGNMGSSDRLQYTVLGDSVNLASRLEQLNKIYGTRILVTETTYESVQHLFIFRPVDRVAVRGKEKGVQIYELLSEISKTATYPVPPLVELAWLTAQAYEAYAEGKWEKALASYADLQIAFPNDELAKIFIKRCQDFMNSPPRENKNPVMHF